MKRTAIPRFLAGLAVTAALLVPLAVFGGPALAKSASSASEYQYSASSQYQYRVQICHLTHSRKHPWHTITISNRAVKAHLKHGDTLGACVGNPPAPANTHGKSGAQHGKSGEHHGKK